MIGDNLEQYTYQYLISLALSFVPEDLDKRQGSVIFDALAPCCQLLAAGAIQLRNFYAQTYALSSTGQNLDNRVAEQGIYRYNATYAVKKVTLKDSAGNPVTVPIGCRFSTVSDTNPVNYAITSQYTEDGVVIEGTYEATCEEPGVVGNLYSGNLINITFIQGLASAYMSATLVPARDEETDDELRQRYFDTINQKAFSGNIADYRAKAMEIPGVGAVQIYPTWNGGGTIKLSIIDPSYNVCAQEFVDSVQQSMDPIDADGNQGSGLGIAPIGHRVTVVTPDIVTVDVDAKISLASGYTLEQVRPLIQESLLSYVEEIRRSWADAVQLNTYRSDVFLSRVSSAIVSVPGVINVTNILLNNASADISLVQSGDTQQLPQLGEVTINV